MATRRQTTTRRSRSNENPLPLAERLLESSLDGILAFDLERRCTFWNPAMERLAGYGRPEALGKSIFDILPVLDTGEQRDHIEGALAGESGIAPGSRFEFARTGRAGYFDAHYAPLLDENGQVAGGQARIREITEYQRALESLRDNREQFRALFEEAPVAYHEIDREGIVRRVNRAECDLLGFEPESMLGRHISEFVSSERREASREAVRAKLAGERPLTPFRRDYVRSDGVKLVLEIHENLIRDLQGRVAGIRSTMLDVTERQRTEEELENRVRERTEALRTLVAERGRAQRRLALQYATAAILAEARSVREAVPRVLEEVCRYIEWDYGAFWELDSRQGQVLGEMACGCSGPSGTGVGETPAFVERVWREREPRWLSATDVPAGFSAGLAFPVLAGEESRGVMAFICGMPQEADPELLKTAGALGRQVGQFLIRHSAEQALQRSEARFAAFMDHLPGIAFMKDLEGRYVYFNAGTGSMAGEDASRFHGRLDEEIWPPAVAAVCIENDRKVLDSGKALETFEQFPHPGGSRWWLIYRFPVLAADGSTLFLGGLGMDVTERRQLEDQLRHSQKMEAVGRLAGGVAHDFNNLLTIIGGYGRMVLEQLPTGDRAQGSIEMMLNAADRAAILTSQLLAFSRRQVVQPKVLQLNHVVSNVEKMLRRVIGEHISLKTALDPNLAMVKVDPGQVEQILMNLAVNARDAMPHGGVLAIETANSEGLVRLSMADTGVGMDTETRSHLFEPFFTTKGRGKGTGLGLSTVYGIVKQHGGEIHVESSPGAGTRFDILLPAVAERQDAPDASAPTRGRSRGTETILLVEDEAVVRQMARDILRGCGYRVLEADGGPAAMRVCEQADERIDLLLTDMIMPLMSGRDLAERVRNARKGIRVIYMSGYTDDVIAYHGDLGPEADFVQKPFAPDALTRKVREVLDRGRQASGKGK